MNKNILVKSIVLTAVVSVCVFGAVTQVNASGSINLSQASNVTVTFNGEDARCDNTFGVSSPITKYLGTNHGTHEGTQFNLGQIPAGELIMAFTGCGGTGYVTGDPSRNPDHVDHTRVTVIGTNQWRIGFEDTYGGGDRDYNDTIITVTATAACTTHASKRCEGTTAVYWYDSCGTRQGVYQTCTANQTCTNGACVDLPVACSSSSQCGTSGYIGTPTCGTNGDVYQTYRTYACSNPGTPQSVCSQSDVLQLKTDCTANQTCTNGSCVNQTITCSTNSQCGTNGYVGSAFCQNGNVYQNYKTYTCNNAGTGNSYCSENTTPQLKVTCTGNQTCSNGACVTQNIACSSSSDCGTNEYTGSPFCQYGNVYQSYKTWTCNNAGTANSACTYATENRLKTTCTGNQTCNNGSCTTQNIACSSNSDCGANAYVDSPFCQNGDVYQNYRTWTCNNAGTANSACSSNVVSQLKTDCTANQTCSNGSCETSYGSLSVNKTVRNITTGSGFASTTNASPGDMLMFMITLQANGQDVQNVFLRDTLPANLIYNNQLVVACTTNGTNNNCTNNVWNYSGDIISGLNLNTISNGQTVTVTYQVQVAGAQNFAFGSTTLNNNVTVTASNNNNIPAGNASVVVTRSAVYGASTINTGLTDNPFVDSFVLPLMITLAGLWAWKSGMFLGLEKRISDSKKKKNSFDAEKELSNRISQIKQTEKGLI